MNQTQTQIYQMPWISQAVWIGLIDTLKKYAEHLKLPLQSEHVRRLY